MFEPTCMQRAEGHPRRELCFIGQPKAASAHARPPVKPYRCAGQAGQELSHMRQTVWHTRAGDALLSKANFAASPAQHTTSSTQHEASPCGLQYGDLRMCVSCITPRLAKKRLPRH